MRLNPEILAELKEFEECLERRGFKARSVGDYGLNIGILNPHTSIVKPVGIIVYPPLEGDSLGNLWSAVGPGKECVYDINPAQAFLGILKVLTQGAEEAVVEAKDRFEKALSYANELVFVRGLIA